MSQNNLTAFLQEIPESFAHCQSIPEIVRSLSDVDLEQRLLALQLLGEGLAIAILNYLPPIAQAELLPAMGVAELIRVLEAMEPDSRYQLLASLPIEMIDYLIARLSEEFQTAVYLLFNVPPD